MMVNERIVMCTAAAAGVVATLWIRRRWRSSATPASLLDLCTFEQAEVIDEGEVTVLLGRFAWQPAGQHALVKLAVRPTPLKAGLISSLELALSSYSGAEYAYYTACTAVTSLICYRALRPRYALEVIAPASDKQIARARPQPGVFVTETASLYEAVTKPYIEALDPQSVAWVYKLLALEKERERLLFNDPDEERGFLLNVDTKWKSHPDCKAALGDSSVRASWHGHQAVRDLYCLAICHRRDVASMRDLRAKHLPLLRHILAEGSRVIHETYGVRVDELRIFVHYQPQFYHFHVHFTRLHDNTGCQVERAHLLQEIISELEADGDVFRKKTLYYQLKANDKLLAALRPHL